MAVILDFYCHPQMSEADHVFRFIKLSWFYPTS